MEVGQTGMDRVAHHQSQESSSDDGARKRNQARDSLFLVAKFRQSAHRDCVSQVRVRNLSSGGLMAEVADPIVQGTAVEFEVRGIGWIPGRVAWSVAGRIGVAFDHPIDPVLARKPVTGGAKAPLVVKPILPVI